ESISFFSALFDLLKVFTPLGEALVLSLFLDRIVHISLLYRLYIGKNRWASAGVKLSSFVIYATFSLSIAANRLESRGCALADTMQSITILIITNKCFKPNIIKRNLNNLQYHFPERVYRYHLYDARDQYNR